MMELHSQLNHSSDEMHWVPQVLRCSMCLNSTILHMMGCLGQTTKPLLHALPQMLQLQECT